MNWISVDDDVPEINQTVIGRTKSTDGKYMYYIGEYTAITQTTIGLKTWFFEENYFGRQSRNVVHVTHWTPLKQ